MDRTLSYCRQTVLFLLLLLSGSRRSAAQQPDAQRYIFEEIGRFGLLDADNKVVLPAAYPELKWEPPYFHAIKANRCFVLLNAAGQAIDSGTHGRPLGDSAFVVMNVPEPDIGVKPGSPVAGHPQRIYYRDGSSEELPGTVLSVVPVDFGPPSLILRSGEQQGVWSLRQNRLVVPFAYRFCRPAGSNLYYAGADSLRPDVLLDDRGRSLPFPPGLPGAVALAGGSLFVADSTDKNGSHDSKFHYRFYDPGGRLLRVQRRSWSPVHTNDPAVDIGGAAHYFLLLQPGTSDDSAMVSLMDGSGNILLESAQGMGMEYGRLLVTYRWLPKEPTAYRSAEADGIYDLMMRRYLLRADAATKIFGNQTVLYSEHDSIRTVYDRKGQVIARFPIRPDRDIEDTYRQIEQHTGIKGRNSQGLFGFRDVLYTRSAASLIALRSDTSVPFVIYDEYLQQRTGLVADDFTQAYGPNEFRCRISGKWGLWQSRVPVSPRQSPLRPLPLLAPRYDSLRCFEPLCQVSVGGRSQWIDRSGKVLAGGKSFAYLQGPVVDGRLLSLAYRNDLSAPVSVIDSDGAIAGTFDPKSAGVQPYGNPLDYDRHFKLLTGGRVLCLLPAGDFIWTAGTLKPQKLDVQLRRYDALSSLHREVVAVVQGKGELEGLFSLVSGKVLLPADTYRKMRFWPYGRSGWMVYGEKGYEEVLVGIVDGQGMLHRRQE